MKITVEISDPLFREAKEHAARHGVPMRALVERGLELALKPKPAGRRRFRLKTVTACGEGLACEDNWSTIRPMIYEGHGG